MNEFLQIIAQQLGLEISVFQTDQGQPLEGSALQTALSSNMQSALSALKNENHKRGMRQAQVNLVKKLKAELSDIELPSDATTKIEDIAGSIIEFVATSKSDPDPKKVDLKHPDVVAFVAAQVEKYKQQAATINSEFEQYKNKTEYQLIQSAVESGLEPLLKEKNFNFGEKPGERLSAVKKLVNSGYKFKLDASSKPYPVDADGEPLTHPNGKAKTYADVVLEEASPFGFLSQTQGKGGAGAKPGTSQGEGKEGVKYTFSGQEDFQQKYNNEPDYAKRQQMMADYAESLSDEE